jgi:hypothetical protein
MNIKAKNMIVIFKAPPPAPPANRRGCGHSESFVSIGKYINKQE